MMWCPLLPPRNNLIFSILFLSIHFILYSLLSFLLHHPFSHPSSLTHSLWTDWIYRVRWERKGGEQDVMIVRSLIITIAIIVIIIMYITHGASIDRGEIRASSSMVAFHAVLMFSSLEGERVGDLNSGMKKIGLKVTNYCRKEKEGLSWFDFDDHQSLQRVQEGKRRQDMDEERTGQDIKEKRRGGFPFDSFLSSFMIHPFINSSRIERRRRMLCKYLLWVVLCENFRI